MQDVDVVRVVAEALAARTGDGREPHRFYTVGPDGRARYTRRAERLLDALAAAGYRVVPE